MSRLLQRLHDPLHREQQLHRVDRRGLKVGSGEVETPRGLVPAVDKQCLHAHLASQLSGTTQAVGQQGSTES